MNKLIISILSSFFTLFIIWCIVGYAEYGSDIENYRLDFKRTIEVFDKEFAVDKSIDNIFAMKDAAMESTATGDQVLDQILEGLYSVCSWGLGLFILIPSAVFDLLTLIVSILDFIFNPKFVHI